jgi:muramoyltetrapeptide carboxypeptidase
MGRFLQNVSMETWKRVRKKKGASGQRRIIKPARLYPGDTIGVVAPASSFNKREFMEGIEKLTKLGFNPVYSEKIFKPARRPKRYVNKAEGIIRMLKDPEVKAIFCAQGGYGSINLIRFLDQHDLSDYCKIILGFSDISILLLYFHIRYGWITFHGPMMLDLHEKMPERTEAALLAALTGTKDVGDIYQQNIEVVRPGVARGRMVGGNLTRLLRTLGTNFEIDTRNKILFLEEVDEGYLGLDGDLNHLRLAGKFDRVRGVLFSEMVHCLDGSKKKIKAFLKRFFKEAPFPVMFGFPSGHGVENLTIPIGGKVCMDGEKGRVIIEESGVR